MIRKIHIPMYIHKGINPSKIGVQKNINLISADTETKPFFRLGLYRKRNNEDVLVIKDITIVKDRFSVFLKEIDKLSSSKKYNVVFFHNLKFDLQILLLQYKKYFYDTDFIMYFDRNDYKEISLSEYKQKTNDKIKVKVFCGSTWFVKMYYGNERKKSKFKKKVHVLDTFAFFRRSLYDLSIKLQLEHKKYKIDFNANTLLIKLDKYLKNDLLTQYDLSNFVLNLHKKYDIRMCVSIAQLSAQVFKHKFLEEGDNIPQISSFFIPLTVKSYHGGKNGFYSENKKVIKLEKMNEYDVNSMYPYAMTQLPNFLGCKYELTREFKDNMEGIYCVSGKLKESKYPIFYTHDFKPIYGGLIKNLWVTSYEIREALRTKKFELVKCWGYLVKALKDRNPLKEFADHFYELKNITPKDQPMYMFYKIMLNSLYGKFIQNVRDNKTISFIYDGVKLRKKAIVGKAGGLFQPLIATLITGFSRAYMHRLERESNSIHTATDSVLTDKKLETSKEMGGISLQNQGDIIIFRNKCYILFGDKMKYAIHGFRGNVKDLLRIYITKESEYKYSRFVNIRESLKRISKPIVPCEWNNFESKLNLNWGN